MSSSSIDVVIVNWNTGDYLARCLESVFDTTHLGPEHALGRVVVVDNASSDDSLERARRWLDGPGATLIANAGNVGFARACNQGAAAGDAPFVLFLNPDARLHGNTLRDVLDFFAGPAGDPVAVCGARVVDEFGHDTVIGGPFPTLRLVAGHQTGLAARLPRIFGARHPTEAGRSGFIDHVIGAFFVTRREVFEELGGFDEGYFMYYEEVDYCLRARQRGWGTFLLRDTRVEHVGNVSSAQVGESRLFYSLRSRRRYAALHWAPWERAVLGVLAVTVELAGRALQETGRTHGVPRQTLRAYGRYVRHVVASRRAG